MRKLISASLSCLDSDVAMLLYLQKPITYEISGLPMCVFIVHKQPR